MTQVVESTSDILARAAKYHNVNLKVSKYHNPNSPGPLYWWQKVQSLHIMGRYEHVVGDLTGLGKTASVLTAYCLLKEKYPKLKMLVVGSKAAALTWEQEVPRWTVGLKYIRVPTGKINLSEMPRAERSKWRKLSSTKYRDEYAYKEWRQSGDILLMNYSQLTVDFPVMVEGINPEDLMVVTDEAHKYHSGKTQLNKVIKQLRKVAKRWYPMTATFMKNRLEEARSILEVINYDICPPEVFKTYYCIFQKLKIRNRYGRGSMHIQQLVGYKNLDSFREITEKYVLAYRDDEPDISAILPELENRVVPVELDKEQRDLYQDIENYVLYQNFDIPITPLTKLLYTQLFVNNPSQIKGRFNEAIDKKIDSWAKFVPAKIQTVLDLLETDLKDEKVIIYSFYEQMVSGIREYLVEAGYKVAVITGQIKDEERAAARDKLDRGEVQIVVVDEAGGESYNLQSAKAIICYDLPWSGGSYCQLIGRIRRLGSAVGTKLIYHLLVPNSIDMYKWNVLIRKFDLLEKIFKGRGVLLKLEGDLTPDEIFEEMRKNKNVGP